MNYINLKIYYNSWYLIPHILNCCPFYKTKEPSDKTPTLLFYPAFAYCVEFKYCNSFEFLFWLDLIKKFVL